MSVAKGPHVSRKAREVSVARDQLLTIKRDALVLRYVIILSGSCIALPIAAAVVAVMTR